MILAGYSVERYASWRQHRADAHIAFVPERRAVFTYDVFAKPGPLLDAQDAADGTGGGTDGSTNNSPEWSSRSVTCGRTLFGSPDRALCVRSVGQCCDKERGNRKQALVHVRSCLVRDGFRPLRVREEKAPPDGGLGAGEPSSHRGKS